jgi:hypothetical protein
MSDQLLKLILYWSMQSNNQALHEVSKWMHGAMYTTLGKLKLHIISKLITCKLLSSSRNHILKIE